MESNSSKHVRSLEWRCLESYCSSRTYDHADTYTCIADHGLELFLKEKIKSINIKSKKF